MPAAADVWVRILGPVEVVTADGHAVAVGGPIVRLLLVQLVLAGDRAVPDVDAIDGVWGVHPPDSVEAALRVHIAHLRRELARLGGTIERRHRGYALAGLLLHTDLDDLSRVEKADARFDAAAELADVERGLALWRGPSLADVRRLPLGERLAAGLDRRRAVLLDRQLNLKVRCGRATEVVTPLERLLQQDPLSEARWGLLATAHYRCGRAAEALETIARAASSLDRIAGLRLGPDLRTLQQQILRHEVPDAPPDPSAGGSIGVRAAPPIPAALVALNPPRLFGRVAELDRLAAVLDNTFTRNASAVVRIHGAAGVGKSALVAHFAHTAHERGLRVLYGWAEKDAAGAMGLLAYPLRGLLADTPPSPVLSRLLDQRQNHDQEPAALDDYPVAERARIIDSVRRVLGGTAVRNGVLIVLDDVQWADELSRLAVRSIARFPVAGPLVVLAVTRTGQGGSSGVPITDDIEVRPLDVEAVAAWAQQASPDDWTQRLLSLTGGLPLLVHTVLRRARPGDDLSHLPPGLGQRMLRDRSATLPGSALQALIVAAVLGNRFRIDDVRALRGCDELELVEDLDAAAVAGLLSYDRDDPDVMCFTHDLMRLAVLDDVPALRRMQLHAAALATISDLPPSVAAAHAQEAGRFLPAGELGRLTIRAARQLLAMSGFDDAHRILATTLTSGRQLAAGPRASMLTLLARAEAATGKARAARGHLHEAMLAARESDDPEVLAEVSLAESLFGAPAAPAEGTPDVIQQVLDRLPIAARETRFDMLRKLAFTHLNDNRLDRALAPMAAARAIAASQTDAQRARGQLLYLEYLHAYFSGSPVARQAALDDLRVLAANHPDTDIRMRFLICSMNNSVHAGDPAQMDADAAELIEQSARLGEPYLEWIALTGRFYPPFVTIDLPAARAAAERAIRRGNESELFEAPSAYASQLFALDWVTGETSTTPQPGAVPSEAVSSEAVSSEAVSSEAVSSEALSSERDALEAPQLTERATTAVAAIIAGDTQRAHAILTLISEDIVSYGRHWVGFFGVALAVEAASALGRSDILERAEPILQARSTDHVVLGTAAMDAGPVNRYLALVDSGLGRVDAATERLEAVRRDPPSGKLWALRADHDLARIGRLEPPPGLPWAWLHRPR